jgi:hypothetical protein
MSWHDEHASVPSWDNWRSAKRRSPIASFNGSAGGASGIGVIDSCSAAGAASKIVGTGACAGAPLVRSSSAKQVRTNRRSDRQLADIVDPERMDTIFLKAKPSTNHDDNFIEARATIVVSVVTVLVPRKIFGLTSIYSNVPQCPVIQVFQSTYHQPCSPLTTHS